MADPLLADELITGCLYEIIEQWRKRAPPSVVGTDPDAEILTALVVPLGLRLEAVASALRACHVGRYGIVQELQQFPVRQSTQLIDTTS